MMNKSAGKHVYKSLMLDRAFKLVAELSVKRCYYLHYDPVSSLSLHKF